MCTVSWSDGPDGLHIFCNRDEQRAREAATPPAPGDRDGLHFLAPRDGRAGGTWIATNERGLAVCLLNHYPRPSPPPPANRVSRGELVLSLMGCPDVEHARALLQAGALAPYQPCIVLLFFRRPGEASAAQPERFAWDGSQVEHTVIERMVPQTSSSFMTEAVIASRVGHFDTLMQTVPRPTGQSPLPEDLLAYHRSHHPTKGAYSVCMHRPDAHTVSFTHLQIGPEQATMDYTPLSPCKSELAPSVRTTLDLVRAPQQLPSSVS